jgi:AcrR family transcriptional regulator
VIACNYVTAYQPIGRLSRVVTTTPISRRERVRAATRAEIKAAALAQLEAGGVEAVSFSAVGRSIGMTPQALYRYYDDRGSLLAELAGDGYRALADALRLAVDTGEDPGDRLRKLAHTYRQWALAHPRLYRLLFTSPADADESLAQAAHRAMGVVFDALEGIRGRKLRGKRAALLESQLEEWAGNVERRAVSAVGARAAIALVSRLHGLVDQELQGQFRSMGLAGNLLLDDEIEALIGGD